MAESENPKIFKKDGVWTVDGRPRETVKVLFEQRPSNLPGKRIVAVIVTVPPNGATPPHTHNGAAVTAFMLSGKCLNQMNNEPPFISKPEEAFFESPGCHHVRNENASDDPSEEASFYAHFIIDDKIVEEGSYEALLVLDADKEQERSDRRRKAS